MYKVPQIRLNNSDFGSRCSNEKRRAKNVETGVVKNYKTAGVFNINLVPSNN